MSTRNACSHRVPGTWSRTACAIIGMVTLISSVAEAANRYWVASASSDWNNAANWSETSDGSVGSLFLFR